MTASFSDRFNRVDSADIGDSYTIPCGGAALFDESVLPVAAGDAVSGNSPILEESGLTKQKTQVLYTGDVMDSPDVVVRGVWSHDNVEIGDVTNAPSFALLARMSKDPLLVDLGSAEDPGCYDQGYGMRVTCPVDGSAPVLKLIKFQPVKRAVNQSRPASAEPDGAQVLASVTLQSVDLIVDETWDETGDFPYRGFIQDMRLRIRRSDNEVILDGYLNDRHMNMPILSFTDRQDPLWGATGVPGFEFISAALATQLSGASPYSLDSQSLMRCHWFSTQTIKDFRRPVTVTPPNQMTYQRVVERVIAIVEKNGDAKYTATTAGQTKIDAYLGFVTDAEKHIIRKEGYYQWLLRESRIYLKDGVSIYELPEDLALLNQLRPGSWGGVPFVEMTLDAFYNRFGTQGQSGGNPQVYIMGEESVNNRKTFTLWPTPVIASGVDVYIVADYYARPLYPSEPDVQIPYVPQDHIDVLIWGAAAHGLLLDTDPTNAQAVSAVFESKLADLRRENNRKVSTRTTVLRSAADARVPQNSIQGPVTRIASLEGYLL